MSAFVFLQLITAPSAVNAFTMAGGSLSIQSHHTSTRTTSATVFVSPLYATSSEHLSSKKSPDHDIKNHLFHTYNDYKDIQNQINELKLSQSSLSEQATHLNISQDALEIILYNGYNARQSLLLENIPLVHYTVKKLARQKLNSLSREDLIQEGTIGLIKAIDKFDPAFGTAFSTYAVYWIRASVLRCIQQREEMIRVPEYLDRAIRAIDGVVKDEEQINGSTKTDVYANVDVAQMSRLTGLTQNVVKEAMKVKQRRQLQFARREGYTALEDYMMKDGKLQQSEIEQPSLVREGHLEHFKDTLGQFLSMKEVEALSWRYGLLQEEELVPVPIYEPAPVVLESRDYEAEAESALFGPSGILAATTATTTVPTPAPPQEVSSLKSTTTVKAPTARITFTTSTAASVASKGGRWGEAMSFKEVGGNMRVSAEYGRRLCSSALKKLKAAVEEGRLEPGMLF